MDGNGRWAVSKKLKKKKGHEAGVRSCIKLISSLEKLDFSLKELSFYVFSSENWSRPTTEIKDLFNLIEFFYKEFEEAAIKKNLRIRHFGSRKRLSKKILDIIDNVSKTTSKNNGPFINLFFNYGSRDEIIEAVNSIKSKKFSYNNITKNLYTAKSNDPDLIIRTSGVMRLSNFMLWQSAYSELFFIKKMWPDFNFKDLNKILNEFILRKRNFGS